MQLNKQRLCIRLIESGAEQIKDWNSRISFSKEHVSYSYNAIWLLGLFKPLNDGEFFPVDSLFPVLVYILYAEGHVLYSHGLKLCHLSFMNHSNTSDD